MKRNKKRQILPVNHSELDNVKPLQDKRKITTKINLLRLLGGFVLFQAAGAEVRTLRTERPRPFKAQMTPLALACGHDFGSY